MTTDDAAGLLRAALKQYQGERDRRWEAVHWLGLKFAKMFSFGEMQVIANRATDFDTIDVVDKAWDGIRAKNGVVWFS